MKLTTDVFSEFDQVWALVTAGTPDSVKLNRVDEGVAPSAPRRNRTCGVTAYGSLQSYMAYFIL